MCVGMCVRACVCVCRLCVCACTSLCVWVGVHARGCLGVYMWVCGCGCLGVHVCVHVYVCAHMRVFVYACMCAHACAISGTSITCHSHSNWTRPDGSTESLDARQWREDSTTDRRSHSASATSPQTCPAESEGSCWLLLSSAALSGAAGPRWLAHCTQHMHSQHEITFTHLYLTCNRVETHKWFKRMLFIRTKHNMWNLGNSLYQATKRHLNNS